jgi:predicted RNA binding protein YcfA (HicA-like mRNA interferase family)
MSKSRKPASEAFQLVEENGTVSVREDGSFTIVPTPEGRVDVSEAKPTQTLPAWMVSTSIHDLGKLHQLRPGKFIVRVVPKNNDSGVLIGRVLLWNDGKTTAVLATGEAWMVDKEGQRLNSKRAWK